MCAYNFHRIEIMNYDEMIAAWKKRIEWSEDDYKRVYDKNDGFDHTLMLTCIKEEIELRTQTIEALTRLKGLEK